ncbi:MAG: carbamoyltransferase HypF [Thermodesulfobacteriota bacterium]
MNGYQQQGLRLIVRGVVQGVGFRPFVYRLAGRCQLCGSVSNCGEGVEIRLQGSRHKLALFVEALQAESPVLASIDSVEQSTVAVDSRCDSFEISVSNNGQNSSALIPPDVRICDDCLSEILSPADRRYGYPFTNCTNCGPRFTIVQSIPYDRPMTSMRDFAMCSSCQAEYDDPLDRRFHAQPNGCSSCGPQLSFHEGDGSVKKGCDPLAESVQRLLRGEILGLRGLGGFHLVVDGENSEAIARLRRKKNRKLKPLAVMVKDLERAAELCCLSSVERTLFHGPQCPIVLLPLQPDIDLPENLAPGMGELGVVLPYTGHHFLLFADPDCPHLLVMTSGNRSGEPICTGNEDGLLKLSGIADCFLLHNRDIVSRVDDSVARVMDGKARLLRRARGYVPKGLKLPWKLPPLLGCGAHLKSTVCVASGNTAWLSQHIGDLSGPESLEFYEETIGHVERIVEIEPEIAVCDLHPDYLSSRYAEQSGLPLYRVQHHHAHVAAVMAENGLDEEVIGVVLDGAGFGPDNTIWGGELLVATPTHYQRVGHLEQLPLPGGDAAAEAPWRMGMALLFHCLAEELDDTVVEEFFPQIDISKHRILLQMMEEGFNTPLTSSGGRLFDGVASLLGLCCFSDFEGQAAMELEALAARAGGDELPSFPIRLEEQKGCRVLSCGPMVSSLIGELRQGTDRGLLALAFHQWLCRGFAKLVLAEHQKSSRTVVLGGGCFQNKILFETLTDTLRGAGLDVVSGGEVPINDGGLSLGQAVIGGLLHVSGSTHAGD